MRKSERNSAFLWGSVTRTGGASTTTSLPPKSFNTLSSSSLDLINLIHVRIHIFSSQFRRVSANSHDLDP